MGRRSRTMAAAAAVAVIAGCASSPPSNETTVVPEAAPHAVAVAEDGVQPSGTPLAPGVQVQEGSSLIGTVFPVVDPDAAVEGDAAPLGWEAVLVVDGDPVDVWNRYTSVLGVDEVASARRACTVRRPATGGAGARLDPADQRFLTEPPLEGEDVVVCRAVTGSVEMELVVGATGCGRDGVDCTAEAEAHLHLRVVDDATSMGRQEALGTDELRSTRGEGPAAPIPGGPVQPPQLDLTDLRTELPAAGEPLDAGLDPFLRSPNGPFPIAAVPDGARSLISPAVLLDCGGGLVAVLEARRSPAGAIDLFDAADGAATSAEAQQGTDADGRTWAAARFDAVGGYGLAVTAVGGDAGRSYVLVTDCGD